MNQYQIITLIGMPLTAVFVAWCGGYNFDARNSDLAIGVSVTIVATVAFTGILGMD
jgi:uncharacterized membrane protein YdjX (TVP38/TMEM64 family)